MEICMEEKRLNANDACNSCVNDFCPMVDLWKAILQGIWEDKRKAKRVNFTMHKCPYSVEGT
jgi:hypothetical protein